MSRRRRATKRDILPDAKFGDTVITRFMNALMYDGKKSAAEGIVYGALDVLKKRGGNAADPVRMFHEALDNVKPAVEVRSRRVGGVPQRDAAVVAGDGEPGPVRAEPDAVGGATGRGQGTHDPGRAGPVECHQRHRPVDRARGEELAVGRDGEAAEFGRRRDRGSGGAGVGHVAEVP